MGATNGKQLRFASLVRVSTERQERQGESLRTQCNGNERDVERLGGVIAGWYGGQEHATPGWERAEVDRLIADAAKCKFDAVIVAYADRWSRDNLKSKEGLDAFRRHGIRFFVSTTEMDLFNPEHRFILGMNAEVGEFIALQQHKKSLESKIERARQGRPTGGPQTWPFGRVFDKAKGTWGIDPKRKAMIKDVAERLLKGESLGKLAGEYGVSHSNLWKVLTQRCGDTWEQVFDSPVLNIHEVVITTVPRLLDEKTIRAVRECLQACRTWLHRPPAPKYNYLLSGRVFCAECGYAMTGQRDTRSGLLYYRHAHPTHGKKPVRACALRPEPRVRADWLEEEVVAQLFDMFGNPAQIERAVRSAVPDCDRLTKRKGQLESDRAKLAKSIARVLKLVVDDAVTEEDAKGQLSELKDREQRLREELDKLASQLDNLPDEESIRAYVQKVGDAIFVYDDNFDNLPGGNDLGTYLVMSKDDKRRLIDAVFGRPLADGSPAGVYVSPAPLPRVGRNRRTRRWQFTLKGLLEFESVVPACKNWDDVAVPSSPPASFGYPGRAGGRRNRTRRGCRAAPRVRTVRRPRRRRRSAARASPRRRPPGLGRRRAPSRRRAASR
jgi:site-specific DNA recombinase